MIHNSWTSEYECADAYFTLIDEGVISTDWPVVDDPDALTPSHRAAYEHWRESVRPDGAELADTTTSPKPGGAS